MRKIPTLFRRDPDDMRHVLPEVTHGCEWVLAGEGVATRKYDGTCVMFDGMLWWARREVKFGKQAPPNFITVEHDVVTDKVVGWEPIQQSPLAKAHGQAVAADEEASPLAVGWIAGTYELIGPKVNGNPERRLVHTLVRHADAEVLLHLPDDLTHRSLGNYVKGLRWGGVEGIVWHHPDGRMAKLKGRDFA